MLEAAFDGESASKRPNRGQPLTVAQQVTKALQDNLKNFSEQEIDGTIVNGSSLRARLTKDKARNVASPGSVTMGRLYYNALKLEFASAESPTKRLQIKDPTLVVAPEVFQAMLASKKVPPQRQPMLQLFHNMRRSRTRARSWASSGGWCN